MNKIILVVSLIALFGLAQSSIMPRSWLTSCKACNDILIECRDCIKGNCAQCVSEIENSRCSKCATEITAAGENLYCDGGIDYHRSVCTYSCRSREVPDSFYRTGTCSAATGKCTCYTV